MLLSRAFARLSAAIQPPVPSPLYTLYCTFILCLIPAVPIVCAMSPLCLLPVLYYSAEYTAATRCSGRRDWCSVWRKDALLSYIYIYLRINIDVLFSLFPGIRFFLFFFRGGEERAWKISVEPFSQLDIRFGGVWGLFFGVGRSRHLFECKFLFRNNRFVQVYLWFMKLSIQFFNTRVNKYTKSRFSILKILFAKFL